jgi:choline dehydrogenase-like flavoprotein
VMPTIPRANTHATTIAIAERAAELFTLAWSGQPAPVGTRADVE